MQHSCVSFWCLRRTQRKYFFTIFWLVCRAGQNDVKKESDGIVCPSEFYLLSVFFFWQIRIHHVMSLFLDFASRFRQYTYIHTYIHTIPMCSPNSKMLNTRMPGPHKSINSSQCVHVCSYDSLKLATDCPKSRKGEAWSSSLKSEQSAFHNKCLRSSWFLFCTTVYPLF